MTMTRDELGITVDEIGRVCHEANRAYCHFTGDPGLPAWDDLSPDYRASTALGVRLALEGSTPERSHTAWVSERLGAGWVYGPVLDREKKIHPNLVPYDQLPLAQRVKDHLFLAIVQALGVRP